MASGVGEVLHRVHRFRDLGRVALAMQSQTNGYSTGYCAGTGRGGHSDLRGLASGAEVADLPPVRAGMTA